MRLLACVRGLGRAALAALMLGTILAPLPGALLDRGPSGEVRLSVFHLALTVFDPSVWSLFGRSFALAVATTLAAWVLGVGLARLARRRGRAGDLLAALGHISLASAPLFVGLGLRGWLAWFSLAPDSLGGWAGGLAWLAAELSWSVPMVGLAAGRVLRCVPPSWEDAARQVGGGRRAWRAILRPVVRPTVARVLATVFTLALVEPGAPLALGLRRTLAVGLVESVLRPDWHHRAASLAVLAVALSAVAGLALRSWGGPRLRLPEPAGTSSHARPSSIVGRLALALVVVACLAMVLAPPTGLALLAFAEGGQGWIPSSFTTLALASELQGPLDRLAPTFALGALVATLGLVVAWLAAQPANEGTRADRVVRAWVVPPVCLAVGVSLVPGLLRMLADALGGFGPLRTLAGWLEPSAAVGIGLAWAVVVSHLPALVAAWSVLESRARPALRDAARVFGRPGRRAFRTRRIPRLSPALVAAWLRLAAIGSLDVASALILTPVSSSRPVGPAVLDLASTPGGLRAAAAVALAATLAGLAAVAVAAAARLSGLAAERPH